MDKSEFTAMVAAECAADPRKIVWLEGFCAGVEAQEQNTKEAGRYEKS